MNTLLLFFALPVATILLAIVFQKILQSPILVGITFFAIYLIVTFAAFDSMFLVFAIVYAILAYLTALIVQFICKILRRIGYHPCSNICGNNDNGCCSNNHTEEDTDADTDVAGATCRITQEDINDIATQAARQTTRQLINAINNANNGCCNRRF